MFYQTISELNNPWLVRLESGGCESLIPYPSSDLMIFHVSCACHYQGVVASSSRITIVPWTSAKLKRLRTMDICNIFRIDEGELVGAVSYNIPILLVQVLKISM